MTQTTAPLREITVAFPRPSPKQTISLPLLHMKDPQQIAILKATGERAPYDREKLIGAMMRAGANRQQSELIAGKIEPKLYDGIPSGKIYRLAYSLLKKGKSHRAAGRYRLKKAIFDLGPSGHPFENFVGRLFESSGYRAKVAQIIQGKCVQHEVDVIALREGEVVIVEAKFRHDYRGKTTVQVPMYIKSRFDDIKAKWEEEGKYKDRKIRGYVVTNARFTSDAIKYAECAGLGLISWDYPSSGSLKYIIDKSGLHPLTSLHTLKKSEQKTLLENGLVLCRDLSKNRDMLKKMDFSDQKISRVLDEAELLIAGQ